MPEAETWQYGIAVVGILFIIMAMFSLGRARKRTAHSRDSGRDHIDRARQKQGVRNELEALMVDINRMARDLGGQLDAKIIRIEKATQEAEERIAQLQALRDELANPAAAQQDQLVTPQAGPDTTDPLTRQVYALADEGKGPADIAQQLDEHVGKVELILALRTG
ncbi:MAG: hypothetical protein KTR15_03035 [Phycisphaeraceae bacterium]|nr:hypothetical protein [Phycisphaeraceae bacterium]